ncbi:hypothetical protein M0R45_024007 [Rubus argutus]|uniref:Splicing factor 3A subunit 1 n=1 Tax=Rubus argutus TaxID=59490 RepID=A0AAW1WRY0_RUBAR
MMMTILASPAPPSDLNKDAKAAATTLDEELNKAKSVSTHTRTIGIIHPPLALKAIIDKTAQYVAKNGPQFEKQVVAKNLDIPNPNLKYSFLVSSNPYHAYYQHRVFEFLAQLPESSEQSVLVADVEARAPKTDSAAQFRLECKVPEPPESEEFTIRLPQGISGEQLDVIKLTAQFVASNGKSFLTGLKSREMHSPQFNFLKHNHSMFTFFTSLADAYSKVLMPPEGLTEKLKKGVADMTTVLEQCVHRLEGERYQGQARQKAEDEFERERMEMAAIDWKDNVVVEEIDFADDEDVYLPPPLTLEEVIRRSKVVANMESEDTVEEHGKLVVEMEMDDEEMQLVEEGMRVTEVVDPEQPPMRILKNWKRPEERMIQFRAEKDMMVSPITGEFVPINEMSEHMRISLIDPKYKEQKERMFAKIRETSLVLAQDDEISRNIVNLARTRPDIFGSTEEEVYNAVNAEIEKKEKQQVIWDSHPGSIGRTAISQNVKGDDHNEARNFPGPARLGVPSVRPLPPPPGLALNLPQNTVHYPAPNSSGLPIPPLRIPVVQFPLVRTPMPPSMFMPPPPSPQEITLLPPTHPVAKEEPKPKRQKLDDSMLIPEDIFMAQHPGPVRINVSVPNVDESHLKGQLLEITVQSLSETVGSLKEKISGEIQFPAKKQKLSGKPGFLKDHFSLAYYNVGARQTLSLSIRERGGRKR